MDTTNHTNPSRRLATLVSLVAMAVLGTGCFWVTTKHEGNKLRKDVDRIDSTVSKQQTGIKDKVDELQSVLDKATKVLTRSSADIGAEVDELARDNAELRGLVMEAKRLTDAVAAASKEQQERLDSLEKRLGEIESKVATEPAKSPEQMFAEAKAAFDAKDYDRARNMFKDIVVRYSTSNTASEAQYYRGETYFREKNYKSAIGEFQKVFDKYPDSRRADEALFRAGESAMSLQWCTDARAYFGVLVSRYPKSSLMTRAKKHMDTLKKRAKDKKYCKS